MADSGNLFGRRRVKHGLAVAEVANRQKRTQPPADAVNGNLWEEFSLNLVNNREEVRVLSVFEWPVERDAFKTLSKYGKALSKYIVENRSVKNSPRFFLHISPLPTRNIGFSKSFLSDFYEIDAYVQDENPFFVANIAELDELKLNHFDNLVRKSDFLTDTELFYFLKHTAKKNELIFTGLRGDFISGASYSPIDNRVAEFVAKKNIRDVEVIKLLDQFANDATISEEIQLAVQELQAQFKSETIGKGGRSALRIENKEKYPGRSTGIDPLEFLKEHYADEISSGTLTPGPVQIFDQSLTASLSARLKSPDFIQKHFGSLENSPTDLGQLFANLAGRRNTMEHNKAARRKVAAATILGTESPDEAARFFSRIKPDRGIV